MSEEKTQQPAAEAKETPAERELTAKERKAENRKRNRKRHLRALRDLILRMLSLALVLYVLFFHLVGVMMMPNADMFPRIDAGDLVLYYRLDQKIPAQSVVVFRKPTSSLEQSYDDREESDEETVEAAGTAGSTARPEKTQIRKILDWLGFADPADPPMTTFVCRVVAGPGDTVEIAESERLIVNGNAVVEPNIFYNTPEYTGFIEYPLKLGEGQYFVLADSRNGGADSRFFGAVNREEILGTVITIMRRNNI